MNVVSYGEVLFDCMKEKEYLGGAPLNFAVHLSNLGIQSYIISRIGNDKRGERAVKEMIERRVHPDFIQIDPIHPTGTAIVTLDQKGTASYDFPEGDAYQFIEADKALAKELIQKNITAFCFGTLVQKQEKTKNSLCCLLDEGNFDIVYYDVNIRFDFHPDDIIKKSLSYTNILKVNEEEIAILSEQLFHEKLTEKEFAVKIADEYQIDIVLSTLGPRGGTVYTKGEYTEIPGIDAPVVSTVGAGDSFGAGFLAAYEKCGDAVKSAQFGIKVASFVITQPSATPIIPNDIKNSILRY